MRPGPGKPVLYADQLDSTFCLYVKATLMHTTWKLQVLDDRWPGLLSQMAFY